MGEEKRNQKFQYEKPELVDMLQEGAKGVDPCDVGTGDDYCYDGPAAGYCSVGTDYGW